MTARSRDLARAAAPGALALALCALAPAAPSEAQGRRFDDVTSVIEVEVPVQVLEGGRPVRGLTAADFEVRDNGKKVPVVGFQVVDLAPPAAAGAELPVPVTRLPISARRHFLLLFDLSFSDPESVVRAQQAALELVDHGLAPADLVGVATYSRSRGMKLALGFTSDRNQIFQALQTLGLADPYTGFDDPLGILIGDLDAGLSSHRRGGAGAFSTSDPAAAGRGLGPDASSGFLINARDLEPMLEKSVRDQREDRILDLSASMSELAGLLEEISGRVHLVLLSEGFDSSVVLGDEGLTLESQARIAEIAESSASGQLWRVDSDARFGSNSARTGLFQMLARFKSANVVIQAVDIGGLRAGTDLAAGTGGQNGLFILANETGGELYRNTNDLARAMGDLLERTSVTYVLSFQPRDLSMDGRYHRLEVRLKDKRRSARLVHRPGYFEPRPFGELSPEERKLMTAALVQGGGEGGAIGLSVLAAPFRVAGPRAYVPVFIEVDGPSALRGTAGEVLPLEIYAYAFDRDGSVRDFFAQAVGVQLAGSTMVLRFSGYKFWGNLDLPPGDYTLRVLVRNPASGTTGVRAVPVAVPAEGAAAALLPPFFPEPGGRWILGREREAGERETPYPFVVDRKAVMPAARPWLRPTIAAEMRLLAYGLGDGDVQVSSRLRGPDGEEAAGTEIEVLGREPGAAPGLDQIVARITPGELPPGPCELTVTVTAAGTAGPLTADLPCEVR